jgi:hypothetical protein
MLRWARPCALALVLPLVGPAVLSAQRSSQIEIGTFLGFTRLTEPGTSTVTSWGVPGGSISGAPAVYVTELSSRPAFLEEQLGYARISAGGDVIESMDVLGRVGWLARPRAKQSPYLALDVAYQQARSLSSLGTPITTSGPGYGGVIGYRAHVGRGLGLRLEAHYRRWQGDFNSMRELGVGVGVGGIL